MGRSVRAAAAVLADAAASGRCTAARAAKLGILGLDVQAGRAVGDAARPARARGLRAGGAARDGHAVAEGAAQSRAVPAADPGDYEGLVCSQFPPACAPPLWTLDPEREWRRKFICDIHISRIDTVLKYTL